MIIMNEKISKIIDGYWEEYVRLKNEDFAVKPSIPVIWFGDLDAYEKSDKKIVTVALNPSNKEFCNENGPSFFRFKDGEKIHKKDVLDNSDKECLIGTLNRYFKDEPYYRWFNDFERPLNFINASYYTSAQPNTAIHIDIYTAVATDPTWGGLSDKQKNKIVGNTKKPPELFMQLLDFLAPDIILYSANKDVLRRAFGFKEPEPWDEQYSTGSKGFNIETYRYKNSLIIYGRNNYGKPFKLKEDFIKDTMKKIKSKYREKFE